MAHEGFAPEKLLAGDFSGARSVGHVASWFHAAKPDVLFEASSLNAETGEPAITHIRTALENCAHAISANKGPVVHAYRELTALAERKCRRFYFESAMMDGAPVFSLFREALPAIEIRGFRGRYQLDNYRHSRSHASAARASKTQLPKHSGSAWRKPIRRRTLTASTPL